MQIRRRCKCGCGRITNPGNQYIHGHYWQGKNLSVKTIKKQSISAMGNTNALGHKYKCSEENKKAISVSMMGNTNGIGYKRSKESKLKQSISRIKHNPNYEYNGSWQDREYKRDIRKKLL